MNIVQAIKLKIKYTMQDEVKIKLEQKKSLFDVDLHVKAKKSKSHSLSENVIRWSPC